MSDAYLNSLLGEREKILLITRQHWFVLLRTILFELILIIATIAAVTAVYIFWNPLPITMLGYLLVLLPLASLIRDLVYWSNHKYVVTNRRVVQLFGVLHKNVTDSSLEKVNDVKMEQSFWGRVFDFGDIEILTASELGINRFTFIGKPVQFKTVMLNAKLHLEEAAMPSFSPAYAAPANPAMDVPRLISELDELRKTGALSEAEFQEKKAKLLAKI
jgi:uncharacterized membrane protein YdbT with pleckstrin-like domain